MPITVATENEPKIAKSDNVIPTNRRWKRPVRAGRRRAGSVRHHPLARTSVSTTAPKSASRTSRWTSIPCSVTAIIGPSGCGKSTFLRSINRMNDLIPHVRTEGRLMVDGHDIYDRRTNLVNLRQQVGMVFQKPNPFPKTIFDNVAYGPRLQGVRQQGRVAEHRRAEPAGGGPVGGGQGRPEEIGPGPFRRPAAAAVHRPGPGDQAPRAADG